MVYDTYNTEDLREQINKVILNIFGTYDIFFDIIDYEKSGFDFDVFKTSCEEFYIIDRRSGHYVNWYKYTHIGRDAHINFEPRYLELFFINFKKSVDKED